MSRKNLFGAEATREPVKSVPWQRDFVQSISKLSLYKVLETYQTSTGLRQSLALKEILTRRQDGRFAIERGTLHIFDIKRTGLNPIALKKLQAIIEACLKHGFIRADNAVGGALSIRKVQKEISLDSILMKLSEDAAHVPNGAVVYFSVGVNQSSYGVVLHCDQDEFVVLFPAPLPPL